MFKNFFTTAWRNIIRNKINTSLNIAGLAIGVVVCLLIGVWFINPALDPGKEGPPFPFSVADLTALFAEGYAVVEDYMPDVAFPGREGRERVRVLRRVV